MALTVGEAVMSNDCAQWYAIWTRPRHERAVRDQLLNKRIDTFLPTVRRWSQWKDRRKRIDWPLFPTYCFAHFGLAERLAVLTCSGVLNIVSIAGEPVPVPDLEVNNIRLLIDHAPMFDPCPLLQEGAEV